MGATNSPDDKPRPRPPEVRYVGFSSTADGREYSFRVTDGIEPRQFVLLIGHEIFAAGEARFQDGPDLCYSRLQRDLLADPDLRPGPRLILTAQELLEYREARTRRPAGVKRRRPAG